MAGERRMIDAAGRGSHRHLGKTMSTAPFLHEPSGGRFWCDSQGGFAHRHEVRSEARVAFNEHEHDNFL